MKNERGFRITVDVNKNAALINGMKKWVLNRRMIRKGSADGYDPNEKICSYRIYKFKSGIILKQIFSEKNFKILQKNVYQKFWNVVCVKNIHASGLNKF